VTDLSVFFAGTAGSVPTARRGLPAVVVRHGGQRLLFDCGEGTQRQLLRSIGLTDLDAVFLTHHHVDHWLGLLGMVKSFALRDREAPLTVYGPPGTRDLLAAMAIVIGRLPYPFSVVDLEAGDEVEFADFAVHALNVRHRGRAFGYALVEEDRPGRFDADRADVLVRAQEAGVERIVNIGYDLPSSRASVALAHEHDQVWAIGTPSCTARLTMSALLSFTSGAMRVGALPSSPALDESLASC